MKLKYLANLLIILVGHEAFADIPRISHESHHLGKVNKIFLHFGRVSLVDFPCVITKTSTGPTGEVGIKVGVSQKNELDIWLKKPSKKSTNLIVRCKELVFVFDLIPSKNNHQDYVKIDTGFGTLLSSDRDGGDLSKVDFENEVLISQALKGLNTNDKGRDRNALGLLFGDLSGKGEERKNEK